VIAVWLAAGQIFDQMGISHGKVEVMLTKAKDEANRKPMVKKP
jgi:hypothetical protein